MYSVLRLELVLLILWRQSDRLAKVKTTFCQLIRYSPCRNVASCVSYTSMAPVEYPHSHSQGTYVGLLSANRYRDGGRVGTIKCCRAVESLGIVRRYRLWFSLGVTVEHIRVHHRCRKEWKSDGHGQRKLYCTDESELKSTESSQALCLATVHMSLKKGYREHSRISLGIR